VRSSTFSSSAAPEGPWLRTWLLAAGLVVALLVGWESTLRALGYRPTVVDDKGLWATQRERVYSHSGEKTIVLLGDCRMQLDSVPQVLAEQFPGHRVVQLAIEQTSPVATLRDLAADERFDGVAICALDARLLCEDLWDTQQPYVDYYHKGYTLNKKLNELVSVAFERRLVILHPELRLDDLIVHLVKTGRLPPPYYIETHADRSRLADYSTVDIAAHRQFTLGRAHWLCAGRSLPCSIKWLEDAMRLEPWVQAIQARGGEVIFMQFPTSGDHLRYDEYMWPKAQYWDAFAAQMPAPCIHWQDVPELAAFACPDWSHLDRTDAPRFTQAFAKALEDRGLANDLTCSPECGGSGGQPCARCDHSKPQGMHARCICCSVNGPS
jgi:hypothetical protein